MVGTIIPTITSVPTPTFDAINAGQESKREFALGHVPIYLCPVFDGSAKVVLRFNCAVT